MDLRKTYGGKEKIGLGKMKRGFSLTEIALGIFLIIVLAAILFPLNMINRNQAQRIALWKSFYPQLEYSFDLMKKDEPSFLKAYESDTRLNGTAFFDEFACYLNKDFFIDTKDYHRYKHRFFNGKIISRSSKYRANRFLKLKNGMVLSFSEIDRNGDKTSPVGFLFVDLDGKCSRNFIGKDVFVVKMYPDRIEPYGYGLSIQDMKEDCSPVGSGLYCAAYYLIGGAF